MKTYFSKKLIIFATILAILVITLIAMLFAPIGTVWERFWIYSPFVDEFQHCTGAPQIYALHSPFTIGYAPYHSILIEQTVVFTLVGVVFVVFLALFVVELARAGVFKRQRRPSKVQQLEARVAELEKQISDNNKGE